MIHTSQDSNSSLQPVAVSETEKGIPHPYSSTKRQVGVHANAAWEVAPEMLGYGPLLPLWRQLTDLLVPLLHKVGAASLLATPAPVNKHCHITCVWHCYRQAIQSSQPRPNDLAVCHGVAA